MGVTDRSHRLEATKKFTSPRWAENDTLFPKIRQSVQCLLTDKKGGERGKRKSLSYIFLIPSISMWPFFFSPVWAWLWGVMINTAGHGKRVALTIEGVVFGAQTHRFTCVSFPRFTWQGPGSQRLAFRRERRGGGGEKKSGYLIIITCGITQRLLAMGKQIKLVTLLNQARSKVLNWVWKGSHEKALECVQGTFELCVRLKKKNNARGVQLINSDWPVSKLTLQTAACDISKLPRPTLCASTFFFIVKTLDFVLCWIKYL